MIYLQRIFKRIGILYEGIGLLCILCIMFFLATTSNGAQFTQQFFDNIRTTNQRQEVVIVGIDDASLQKIGAWPWNRNVFAELTTKLSSLGAKVIVYDVLFLEQRAGDDEFRMSLQTVTSTVILAGKMDKDAYLTSFLLSTSTRTLSGLSNVMPDVDGKVRMYPSSKYMSDACLYGLAEQAFRIVTFKKDEVCIKDSANSFRYPEKITTYSVVDILSDKIAPEKLQGKVVFIGSTSLDLEDHFVGMGGEKIPGVQVHASIFSSLMNKEGDREASLFEICILLCVSIFMTVLLLRYTKTVITQIVSVILFLLLISIGAYICFVNHLIIPLPWLLVACIITASYSTLIRFISERKKSEHVQSLFSKYVHKDVLHELMKSPGALTLTGEKQHLTVLFSDLRGFTTLSESLSPEALTTVLNGYFSAMTPIILHERGTIDKFIGDAIMAFWNAPLRVEHHELHAVLAAISMQEELAAFNDEYGYTLEVGVGIHAGDAVVGNVGGKDRVNYTILGDTVNLASRIEGLTKKYGVGILVTDEVRNKINDTRIMFRKLDVITVKGKTVPTVLYEARRVSDLFEDITIDYEIAFSSYQKGEFDEARVLFKSLADRGDIPSHMMYERISTLTKSDTWDGVWHFDEK